MERMRRLLAQSQDVARQLDQLEALIGSDPHARQMLANCLEAQHNVVAEIQRSLQEWGPMAIEGEDARFLALYDEVTGLPSRMLFQNRIQSAFVLARELGWTVSVMFIDLDKFKAINDAHGHEMGDEVLRVVGQRLRSSIRETDVVARIGGDEFVCLLMDVRADVNLAKIAAKIIEQVSGTIEHRGTTVSVNPSIGIARYPQNGEDPDSLIRSADIAMYAAKRNMMGYAFASNGDASA